jgi:hypothetical protein
LFVLAEALINSLGRKIGGGSATANKILSSRSIVSQRGSAKSTLIAGRELDGERRQVPYVSYPLENRYGRCKCFGSVTDIRAAKSYIRVTPNSEINDGGRRTIKKKLT